jgi:hypothetical protein
MTLPAHEFIRRFLLHVLPKGFHRIRHYGLLASGVKAGNLARMRELLDVAPPPEESPGEPSATEVGDGVSTQCRCCGGRMHIIERFEAGKQPRHHASPSRIGIRIDTS